MEGTVADADADADDAPEVGFPVFWSSPLPVMTGRRTDGRDLDSLVLRTTVPLRVIIVEARAAAGHQCTSLGSSSLRSSHTCENMMHRCVVCCAQEKKKDR